MDKLLDKFRGFKDIFAELSRAMERSLERTQPRVYKEGSQYEEFKTLRALLPEDSGFYVDVGAGEPVECSNTWEFYKLGWRGLLIECLPTLYPAILRNRPGDFVCPLAVSDSTGFARLRPNNSLSSIKPDWDIPETPELLVECDTLDNILKLYPQIRDNCSLLSVDVEGSEKEAIAGIDWEVFQPKVIIIEAFRYTTKNEPMLCTASDWENILLRNGYCLHYKGTLNYIYRKR